VAFQLSRFPEGALSNQSQKTVSRKDAKEWRKDAKNTKKELSLLGLYFFASLRPSLRLCVKLFEMVVSIFHHARARLLPGAPGFPPR
jgi:hypothetical protein